MDKQMPLKPKYEYPYEYRNSIYEIDLICECHPGESGKGYRSGVGLHDDWAVYRVFSSCHPELYGCLVALTSDGLIMRRLSVSAEKYAQLEARVAELELHASLRPEVIAFARLMEDQLRANDHKPGWIQNGPFDLWPRLMEEAGELKMALIARDGPDVIAKEAADVANFAMMIADVIGGLSRKE